MRTVVLGPRPVELEALIAERRARGADLFDEVWEGEYHMAPAPSGPHAMLDADLAAVLRPPAQRVGLVASGPFNLGQPEDFRVPDHALHREPPLGVWVPTAALVVEIVSPDDESWAKLDFYAAHGVDEVVMADPATRAVVWLARHGDGYQPTDRSAVLGVDVAAVSARITWPPLSAE
jgi:Uma2 family endonuclease